MRSKSAVKAAKRARVASSAAAANANSAAQNAALAAQSAASMAQAAASNAAVLATSAAQNAGSAAQNAANAASKGVKQGVYSARSWAAPRLDSAAEYCTTTVAPKVSTVLHSTARQVSPPKPPTKRSSVLIWSLLGGAILAAAGAAAAMVRYRYRTAIAADSESVDDEVLGDSTGSQAAPASPDGNSPGKASPKDKDTDTSVNGRVTATGW